MAGINPTTTTDGARITGIGTTDMTIGAITPGGITTTVTTWGGKAGGRPEPSAHSAVESRRRQSGVSGIAPSPEPFEVQAAGFCCRLQRAGASAVEPSERKDRAKICPAIPLAMSGENPSGVQSVTAFTAAST